MYSFNETNLSGIGEFDCSFFRFLQSSTVVAKGDPENLMEFIQSPAGPKSTDAEKVKDLHSTLKLTRPDTHVVGVAFLRTLQADGVDFKKELEEKRLTDFNFLGLLGFEEITTEIDKNAWLDGFWTSLRTGYEEVHRDQGGDEKRVEVRIFKLKSKVTKFDGPKPTFDHMVVVQGKPESVHAFDKCCLFVLLIVRISSWLKMRLKFHFGN